MIANETTPITAAPTPAMIRRSVKVESFDWLSTLGSKSYDSWPSPVSSTSCEHISIYFSISSLSISRPGWYLIISWDLLK